jgi:hypothetical protein
MNIQHRAKLLEFFKQNGLVFVWQDDLIIGVVQGGDVENLVFDY